MIRASHNICYGRKIFVFNLPTSKTCKPTKWCLINCCARKDKFNTIFKKLALRKYVISQSKDFPNMVIEEIKKKKIRLFRLHSSGDFYSEDYVKKWIKIAKNCHDTFFRTTTRRFDLAKSIRELNNLPNFVVRESIDPLKPKPIMGLPIAAFNTLPIAKNFFKCIGDCEKCGYYCWYHKVDTSIPVLTQIQWEKEIAVFHDKKSVLEKNL